MRAFVLSLIAGLFFVPCFAGCNSVSNATTSDQDTTSANIDMKKFAGIWTLVSGEVDGTPLPEQDVKNSTLTIIGDAYTVQLSDLGVKKGIQKLDPTKAPKQIDAHDASGPTVGYNLGIYEFAPNGDLRVCFGAPGKERPTEFVTKPGSGHFMHLWRRAEAN